MTVAPGALAPTAANTRKGAGRNSAAAVFQATTMSLIARRVGCLCPSAVAEGSVPATPQEKLDYSRQEARDQMGEKHQLRLASCDESLFIIASPLDLPSCLPPSTPLTLPSGDSIAPARGPSRPPPHIRVVRQGLRLLQAVRRHHDQNQICAGQEII
jgi:hypothetical protein